MGKYTEGRRIGKSRDLKMSVRRDNMNKSSYATYDAMNDSNTINRMSNMLDNNSIPQNDQE